MAKTGAGSRTVLALVWLVVGAAMVLVPAWLGWTRWQAVLTGHPLTLALSIALLLFGFVALAWSVATLLLGDRSDRSDRSGREEGPRPRTERERRRRANRRVALAVPALFVCVLAVGALAWSRPLPATPVALAAMRSGNGVRVTDRITWYELIPAARNRKGDVVKPRTGLVFVPGARVDPRAYARVLRPLAEAGYFVAVLKEPFGLALADAGHAGRAIGAHPEIGQWVIGGHSLGGVAAAAYAQDHAQVNGAPVAGLVLYGAYPAGTVNRADLAVTSISGDLDRLTTPDDIARSKAHLPAGTRYVVVPGAVHSFFGDYGEQDGDGTPTADRTVAQVEIAQATRALLASVTPKPRKK
jgi:pimeloyl-ACP methyl ester carboxylesterase